MPKNIGIIMDGNRRWAKERGLPSLVGHEKGADKLKELSKYVFEKDVENLVVYAFSTENWKRSKEEVDHLMKLPSRFLGKDQSRELLEDNVRVRVLGEKSMLSEDLQEKIKEAESINSEAKYTLWIALSYGSRLEILRAAQSAACKYGDSFDEEQLRSEFWSSNMPDPDIIIRSGGERRLSNFLLWQAAYSELFFTDTYWPDFSKSELDAILDEYAKRKRRFGK